MREIKYKVWDEDLKVMANVVEIMFHGKIKVLHDKHDTICHNFKLLQFTGLKDSKGVDIYEGGIVRIKINHNSIAYQGKNPHHYSYTVELVEFWEGKFITYKPKENPQPLKNYSWGCLTDIRTIVCEVIGNVWENADLLKGV